MGRTLVDDIRLATSWGYPEREAVRVVARLALLRAEQGARYSEGYLRELHGLMVATAPAGQPRATSDKRLALR
jgi:hypothetical protein